MIFFKLYAFILLTSTLVPGINYFVDLCIIKYEIIVYPPKKHRKGRCLLTFGQAGCPSFNCLCPLSVKNKGHRTSDITSSHNISYICF